MARIAKVTADTANAEQAVLLDAIKGKLGMVPNFLAVLAQSPVALNSFLGLHGVAGAGELDAPTRERIAIALADENACQYCLSAHTAIGRKTGLTDADMAANRDGGSTDDRAAAAVRFALSLNKNRGALTASEFNAVRDAGYSDAEIVEIVVHVGMNLLTNILAKSTEIDIDFPKVALTARAA
ncbi:carboxymuconolactone decarboxylase family protein [Nisaea sediminum]|uniref:carboxymuconolactone decarboxylase family protein n=1 Tax=Nisaea sediminum TaxID=2775867 RepID=UPI0018661513|nr:carboxymuconolactone decarboxylase family protein [Nisaea sediminum]